MGARNSRRKDVQPEPPVPASTVTTTRSTNIEAFESDRAADHPVSGDDCAMRLATTRASNAWYCLISAGPTRSLRTSSVAETSFAEAPLLMAPWRCECSCRRSEEHTSELQSQSN